LNLTINAQDIDGDTLDYSTNRTNNIGLDDLDYLFIEGNIISFLPTNNEVGVLAVNITISDNNGSRIYQNLEIEILNTNDPPYVKITYPTDGSEFNSKELINFGCEWSDVDFDVPEPTEHLTFTWYTSLSENPIGTGENLINLTLEEGRHQITVEVEDDYGAINTDSINITISSSSQGKDKSQMINETLLWVIIIVIIIIILVTLFIFYKRKKQAEEAARAEAASPEVLVPDIVDKPAGEPLPSAPTLHPAQQLTPSVAPTPMAPSAAPQPEAVLGGPQPQETVPRLPPPAEPEAELPEVEYGSPASTQPVDVPTPVEQAQDQSIVVSPQPQEVDATAEVSTPEPGEDIADQPQSTPMTYFCPNCNNPETVTFPDGSSSCSVCGYKWL
jgi:hypothetical protein